MQQDDNSNAEKLQHFDFDRLKKEHEQLLKKVQQKIDSLPKTKVYQNLLLVEEEINNSGKAVWVNSSNPSPWQNLIAEIVVYNRFHEGNKKDYGEQYLLGALKEYDKVYQHYVDKLDINSPLKISLDNLLESINATIQECQQKKLKQ